MPLREGLLLSLSAAAPNDAAKGKQANSSANVERSLQSIATAQNKIAAAQDAAEYKAPCDDGKANDKSDLCAQWYAADAARDAADWAFWAMLIGIVSAVGIVVALGLTMQSNAIARDTAKRQLRAYLIVEPGGINVPIDGLHRLPLNLINNGQTPAYDLEHAGDIIITSGDPRQFDPEIDGRLAQLDPKDVTATSDGNIGPKTNRFMYAYLEEDLPKPFWDKIFKKEAAVIHYGFFRYKDVFGEQRQTNFAFYHWSDDLSDENAKRCRFGNSAT